MPRTITISDELYSKLKDLTWRSHKSIEELLDRLVELDSHDLPTEALMKLVEQGGSLDFLNNPEEDVYPICS